MLTHISLSSLKVLGQSQNNIYSLISPVSKQYWSQQNAINQPEEVCCVILVGDSHPAVTVYNRVLEFYNINSSCQDRSLYNNGWRLLVCSFHHRPAHQHHLTQTWHCLSIIILTSRQYQYTTTSHRFHVSNYWKFKYSSLYPQYSQRWNLWQKEIDSDGWNL